MYKIKLMRQSNLDDLNDDISLSVKASLVYNTGGAPLEPNINTRPHYKQSRADYKQNMINTEMSHEQKYNNMMSQENSQTFGQIFYPVWSYRHQHHDGVA